MAACSPPTATPLRPCHLQAKGRSCYGSGEVGTAMLWFRRRGDGHAMVQARAEARQVPSPPCPPEARPGRPCRARLERLRAWDRHVPHPVGRRLRVARNSPSRGRARPGGATVAAGGRGEGGERGPIRFDRASESRIRVAHPSHTFESHIRVAHPSRASESYIRVTHPSRASSRASESRIRADRLGPPDPKR